VRFCSQLIQYCYYHRLVETTRFDMKPNTNPQGKAVRRTGFGSVLECEAGSGCVKMVK
jgi:hypothetical protein